MTEMMQAAPEMFSGILWAYYWFWFAQGAAVLLLFTAICAVFIGSLWVLRAFIRGGSGE